MDILHELYQTVEGRRQEKQEGSYTCYLFEKGLDKILKKCGEECSEVIIAAKNGKQEDTVGELAEKQRCYKLMLMTGSKQESTLRFYREAGYRDDQKTAFVQWLP